MQQQRVGGDGWGAGVWGVGGHRWGAGVIGKSGKW